MDFVSCLTFSIACIVNKFLIVGLMYAIRSILDVAILINFIYGNGIIRDVLMLMSSLTLGYILQGLVQFIIGVEILYQSYRRRICCFDK